ncbi:MAG: RluA family pseudouridine synthase [Acidobacteriota bacterium]
MGLTDEKIRIVVLEGGGRLDAALAHLLEDRGITRSALRRLMDDGRVRVNGRRPKPSESASEGQLVEIELPAAPSGKPIADRIPLDVLYEDEDCLAVDKPAGMVTHPAAGHWEGTLVNALLGLDIPLSDGFQAGRPGIVHRLDKETSGIVLVAKNNAAQAFLSKQFKERSVQKVYKALLWGALDQADSTVDGPIGRDPANRKRMKVTPGGRPSLTRFTVEERLPQATLVRAVPHSGRTHQIRVHAAHLHHPVVGDVLYGGRREHGLRPGPLRRKLESLGRFLLHAHQLVFQTQTGGRVTVTSPVPSVFSDLLEEFRGYE